MRYAVTDSGSHTARTPQASVGRSGLREGCLRAQPDPAR